MVGRRDPCRRIVVSTSVVDPGGLERVTGLDHDCPPTVNLGCRVRVTRLSTEKLTLLSVSE